jgi:hypothetical protein
VATSFEAKLGESVILGFEAKPRTCAPHLLVHGADRT